MNDFTKEELERILDVLDINPWDLNEVLMSKIQSLIDNYCEHETDGYTYYKSGDKCTDFLTYASSDSPCFLKCKKCEKLFR